VEIPISLVVGVLLLSLGIAVGAVIRTFQVEGKVTAIDKILEPMPEVHRSAAEMKARISSTEKQLDELKHHLDKVRLENREAHRLDREENIKSHEKIEALIRVRNCEPEGEK